MWIPRGGPMDTKMWPPPRVWRDTLLRVTFSSTRRSSVFG